MLRAYRKFKLCAKKLFACPYSEIFLVGGSLGAKQRLSKTKNPSCATDPLHYSPHASRCVTPFSEHCLFVSAYSIHPWDNVRRKPHTTIVGHSFCSTLRVRQCREGRFFSHEPSLFARPPLPSALRLVLAPAGPLLSVPQQASKYRLHCLRGRRLYPGGSRGRQLSSSPGTAPGSRCPGIW
jgi:hypothetical protein